jgi:hypothetical protein
MVGTEELEIFQVPTKKGSWGSTINIGGMKSRNLLLAEIQQVKWLVENLKSRMTAVEECS